MMILITICLLITAVIVSYFGYLFATDEAKAFAASTHLPEKLPKVMADRYAAMAIIALGLIFFGSLPMIAVFFVACAVMGLGDGIIYARAGVPHIKHTITGVLALVAFGVTITAMLMGA